jgi:hypothetical protein
MLLACRTTLSQGQQLGIPSRTARGLDRHAGDSARGRRTYAHGLPRSSSAQDLERVLRRT